VTGGDRDLVLDFKAGVDVLWFRGDDEPVLVQAGEDVEITHAGGVVVVVGAMLAQVQASLVVGDDHGTDFRNAVGDWPLG